MSDFKDYYLALEIAPGASREMIAEAYERLAKRYQPDPNQPPKDPEAMAAIDEAFDVLDDPARRAEYDRQRAETREAEAAAAADGGGSASSTSILLPALLIGGGIIAIVAAIALLFVALTDDDDSNGGSNAEVTTPSGLRYTDLVVGEGAQPQAGDTVVVHYTGTLEDGTVFDSSVDRGVPFDFILGTGAVIEGWDEGIATMRVGGKRILVVPPELGYGDQQYGPIPANATLTFEVELLEIQ
jgi:hypothetical protein